MPLREQSFVMLALLSTSISRRCASPCTPPAISSAFIPTQKRQFKKKSSMRTHIISSLGAPGMSKHTHTQTSASGSLASDVYVHTHTHTHTCTYTNYTIHTHTHTLGQRKRQLLGLRRPVIAIRVQAAHTHALLVSASIRVLRRVRIIPAYVSIRQHTSFTSSPLLCLDKRLAPSAHNT